MICAMDAYDPGAIAHRAMACDCHAPATEASPSVCRCPACGARCARCDDGLTERHKAKLRGGPLQDAILAALVKGPLHRAEIGTLTNTGLRKSIDSVLSHMVKRGQVARVRPGVYALP